MNNKKELLKSLINNVFYSRENRMAKNLQASYNIPQKYKRIYHVHVRKTAGTSLNLAFFSGQNKNNAKEIHTQLSKNRYNLRTIRNNEVFVGWDKNLLEHGNYLYGFSHIPMHKLHLPKETFTVTILRDPIKRVISHYNMLHHYLKTDTNQELTRTEKKWASVDFDTFLKNTPNKHLMNQLYMFSKNFDVSEAIDNILSLNYVMFTETYKTDLEGLSKAINRELPKFHEKSNFQKGPIKLQSLSRLEEMMQPEKDLISSVQKALNR